MEREAGPSVKRSRVGTGPSSYGRHPSYPRREERASGDKLFNQVCDGCERAGLRRPADWSQLPLILFSVAENAFDLARYRRDYLNQCDELAHAVEILRERNELLDICLEKEKDAVRAYDSVAYESWYDDRCAMHLSLAEAEHDEYHASERQSSREAREAQEALSRHKVADAKQRAEQAGLLAEAVAKRVEAERMLADTKKMVSEQALTRLKQEEIEATHLAQTNEAIRKAHDMDNSLADALERCANNLRRASPLSLSNVAGDDASALLERFVRSRRSPTNRFRACMLDPEGASAAPAVDAKESDRSVSDAAPSADFESDGTE